MAQFENNLTEGSVAKQLIRFSLPFIISNIIQSFYAVADMIIVGQFSDEINMSGVNIGGQVTFLVTNAVIGLCVGATVLIGQYLGSGKKNELKDTIGTLFSTLLVLSVVITVSMMYLDEPMLRLINTPEASFNEAKSYFNVTMLGTIFIFGYNALSAVMRGMGDSKNPLTFVIIACGVNVVLDLILVAKFNMGAEGAAIATVISQGISMILCILYLKFKNFIFDFTLSSFRFHGERLLMLLKIGVPTLLNNITVSISFLFLLGFINNLGVTASAAVGAVAKYNAFAILPPIAISSAISAMSAQNFGAGKVDRAVKTMKIGIVIAISISYTMFILTQLFPEYILKAFNDNEEFIQAGVTYIRTFSFDYLTVPLIFCLNGLFIGTGHTFFSLSIGIISSLLVRIPAAYIFGDLLGMGLTGFGLGAPFASGVAFILAFIYYKSGKWKKQVIIKKEILEI
ncbi:MAG TPA: MATE family efflux transporter [Clostridiales bacterium]|nr:MATE family efflux transporter [Clostridiales bacterium]